MKSEQKIREELKRIIEQERPIEDSNPTAYNKLTQRALALCWVLGIKDKGTPRKLTLNDKTLKFLECFW